MGHTYMGHTYMGHTYIGHTYIGHSYIGHNYTGPTLLWPLSTTTVALKASLSARTPDRPHGRVLWSAVNSAVVGCQ